MRKSSLGTRGTSGRIPSLSGMPETLDGVSSKRSLAKSFIPQPLRSRSSSTGRNQPAAVLMTPVVTPIQAHGSVIKNQGLRETATIKDQRPLSDKNFQMLAVCNIYNYFKENDVMDINKVPKTLSSWSLTLKSFVEMSNHLLSRIFGGEVITVANYTEKIPQFAKEMRYPNVVKKSWLVTANSPHSMPQVIGFLSWLVDVVKATCNMSEVMFPPEEKNIVHPMEENNEEETIFKYITSKRLMQYYIDSYEKFAMEQDNDLEAHQLKQDAMDTMNVNDNDFKILYSTLSSLEQELEKSEVVREVAENQELQSTKAKIFNELSVSERSLQQKVAYFNEQQQKLEELHRNIVTIESTKDRCAENVSQMSEHLKTQRCTPEDIVLQEKRCNELEENINLDANSIEMWSKENYTLDLEMTRIRAKLNVVFKDYTTPIVKNADMFPELEDLKVLVNINSQDAIQQLQDVERCRENIIKKLQEEGRQEETIHDKMEDTIHASEQKVQQLSEKLCQENKHIEDLKQELAVLNDNFRRQKQNEIESLNQLQDETNAIKIRLSDSVPSEKKLEELVEGKRKITEHIQSVREEADKCFQEIGIMYREYADKIRKEVKPLLDLLDAKNMKH